MATTAGRRRHLIRFERRSEELNAAGVLQLEWVPAFGGRRFFSEAVDLSGRELIAAAAVNAKTTTRFHLAAMPGLDASMRIEFEGRLYNIEAVIADQHSRNRDVVLNCSVGTNEG